MAIGVDISVFADLLKHEFAHSVFSQLFFFKVEDYGFSFDRLELLFLTYVFEERVLETVTERSSEVRVKH